MPLPSELPRPEVEQLKIFLKESLANNERWIVVNYPINWVVAVAGYFHINIKYCRIVCVPSATPEELMHVKQLLEGT